MEPTMPTIDHTQIARFRARYLRHDPPRHALMRGPQADRKYTEYRQPITDAQIGAHLDGRITLAAPLIGPDGLTQTAALDIDSGGTAALRRALDTAKELGWTAYAITSMTEEHNGGHVWLHLDTPTAPDRARLLAQTIAEAAQIEAETYPTRKQLRLPLGVHRWTGQRGTLLLQDGTILDLDINAAAIIEAIDLIAALPTNSTTRLPAAQERPQPPRHQHTLPIPRQNVSGDARSAIQAYNQATDLISLLERYGARIAEHFGNGGALLHCPCGRHSYGDRRPSLHVQPARSQRYGRFVVFGYAPVCQFYAERGQTFAAFDVFCALEGITVADALKRINPRRPAQAPRKAPEPEPEPEPAPRIPTPEEHAEQRRTRIAEAHATHAELRARMMADQQISARARAILGVLLSQAVDRAWCRLSTTRIATDFLQVSERTVQRGIRELEQRGYITSDTHTSAAGRAYQGGSSTTVRRFLRVTPAALPCRPCVNSESDSPSGSLACEPPPDVAPSSSPMTVTAATWDGGAHYNPAEDWTLQATPAPQRKPWRASVPPKDFFTLYRAGRERTAALDQAAPIVKPPLAEATPHPFPLELAQADLLTPPSPAAQAQLAHITTQIWRTPPSDPKKRRTYYVLKRKADQVARSNPKQAYALRMQARALEDVSDLLIAATSTTSGQDSPAPTQPSRVTHRRAEAAPGMPGGGLHAQPTEGIRQVSGSGAGVQSGRQRSGEGRNVAVGDIDTVVAKLPRQLQAGVAFSQPRLDATLEEALGKTGAEAVQSFALDATLSAGSADGVLQAAGEGGAVSPEPMATRRNGVDRHCEFGAGDGIEFRADSALPPSLGVGAAHVDSDDGAQQIFLLEAGDLGMAEAGGVEQIEHSDQLIATTLLSENHTNLLDLLGTVATAGRAPTEAGIEFVGDQLVGSVGIPLAPVHALTELAEGGQRGLEMGIGGPTLLEDGEPALDQLRGHVAEHAGLVVAQGVEQDHAAVAVGVERAIAEDVLVVGAVPLGLVARGSFLEQGTQQAIDLVFERRATAHGGAP